MCEKSIKNIIVRDLNDQDNQTIQEVMKLLNESTASKCVIRSMEEFIHWKKQAKKLEQANEVYRVRLIEMTEILNLIQDTFSLVGDWQKVHKKRVDERVNFLNGH